MVTLYILERFGGLDWGDNEKNILHHGTAEPPTYDLQNVNTKVWIIPILSWIQEKKSITVAPYIL